MHTSPKPPKILGTDIIKFVHNPSLSHYFVFVLYDAFVILL